MTAVERVRRTQRLLAAAALARALGWGIGAALAIAAVIAFAALVIPGLRASSSLEAGVAVVIGATIAAVLLWRARHFASAHRVALWIEERVPALQYSLVTALEYRDSAFAQGMEEAVASENVGGATVTAMRKGLLLAGGALVVGLLLLYVSPSTAFELRGRGSAVRGRFGISPSTTAGSRLDDLRVFVTPPAYTGERAITLRDPSSVAALVGSAITVRGSGPRSGLSAALATPLRVSTADGGWTVALQMPSRPAALKLTDRSYERVIVLAPRADEPPKIALTAPVRDTTLRAPRLVLQLRATATDDIGLSQGYFEYLITTGSGEIFKTRTITTPVVNFARSRSGSLNATLDLASLKLSEGDVVSMRAIAQDGNTLSGPGIATSDTRTIRIARSSEYDSLSIEAAAPPPIDSSAMSQRMLVVMTEQLVRDQPKLARAELVKRSTEIGDLEDRIRKRVQEVLAQTEEEEAEEKPGDAPATIEQMEAPEEATGKKNPDLVTAYNALWQAVRSLQIAEPAPALPPMRVALQALDRARLANRLYLRGAPPKIVVDIQRVRLSGKEKGSSSTRSPRSFADSARSRLSARFAAVIELIQKDPRRAITELALLRVEALTTMPEFAAALGEASDAMRSQRDATLPLLRARRALMGKPEVTPGLPLWTGGE